MVYQLPPLTALRAFEAVARLSSFKAAAAELFVTPTAISHQIRMLETYFGLRMFERTARGVALTPEGHGLFGAATQSFTEISREVARLKRREPQTILTLTSSTAFLSHWLVPRLGELRELLPDLDLRLHASNAAVELKPGGIDLAIRYGAGPYPDTDATLLAEDLFAPLCSPAIGIRILSDLSRFTLIHVDGRVRPAPPADWPLWCKLAGASDVDTGEGLHLPDSLLATQAAIAGQGIAILSLVLAADALKAGLLVQPFAQTMKSDSYHFLSAPGLGDMEEVGILRKWFQTSLTQADAKS